jgi:hypothetical protein
VFFEKSSLTGGLMMIKQIECRVLESRPVPPTLARRPNRRIESIEKPRPQGEEGRYEPFIRPAGVQKTYNFKGRIDGWDPFVCRIDVRA